MAGDRLKGHSRTSASGWTRRGLRCCLVGILVFTAGFAGCASESDEPPPPIGETVEVKGRVLLSNGDPLTAGRVVFVAADGISPPASGDVGPDGSFALTTQNPGDGAVPGQ